MSLLPGNLKGSGLDSPGLVIASSGKDIGANGTPSEPLESAAVSATGNLQGSGPYSPSVAPSCKPGISWHGTGNLKGSGPYSPTSGPADPTSP